MSQPTVPIEQTYFDEIQTVANALYDADRKLVAGQDGAYERRALAAIVALDLPARDAAVRARVRDELRAIARQHLDPPGVGGATAVSYALMQAADRIASADAHA